MDRFIYATALSVMRCRREAKDKTHDDAAREMFAKLATTYEEIIIRRARYLMGEA